MKKDITITEECPLIVSSTASDMEYGTVTLYPGAYIEIRIGGLFHMDVLIKVTDDLQAYAFPGYDIIVKGEDGEKGTDRTEVLERPDCKPTLFLGTEDDIPTGGNGGNAADGATGGRGGNGESGPNLILEIGDLRNNINVLNIGGRGGDGGRGGNGGDGGNACDGIGRGTGGNGGNGGNGGIGGNGGNGGNGGTLTISYQSSNSSKVFTNTLPASGGRGGSGGKPGNAGKAGKGGNYGGQPGNAGNAGKQFGPDGIPGNPGNKGITLIDNKNINQKIKNKIRKSSVDSAAIYDSPLKENGRLVLDYSNPEHFQYVIKKFGGEDLLRSKYPLVYQAMLKTKNKDALLKESTEKDKSVMDMDLFCDLSPVTCIQNTSSRLSSVINTSSESYTIESQAVVHSGNEDIPYLKMNGYMYAESEEASFILDTFDNDFNKIKAEKIDIVKSLSYQSEDITSLHSQTISSYAEFHTVSRDSTMKTICCKNEGKVIAGLPYMKITSPFSLVNNPINILYGRGVYKDVHGNPIEAADYIYPDNSEKAGQVAVLMPFSGSITFNDNEYPLGYSIKDSSMDICMTYSTGGTVYYNYNRHMIAQCFSLDSQNPHKINFNFMENWNAIIKTADIKVSTILTLHCPFFIKYSDTRNGAEKGVKAFSINSVVSIPPTQQYYEAYGTSVKIPQIKVRWGCFAKDTKILMADGNLKDIFRIQKGEKIKTADNKTVTVNDVIIGWENELVYIETKDNAFIKVTKNHPIETDKGIEIAENITTEYNLKRSDGGFAPVKFAFSFPYNDYVYNLNTGNQVNMIIANGFVTGDYLAQNSYEKESQRVKESYSKELTELIEELKRLQNDN